MIEITYKNMASLLLQKVPEFTDRHKELTNYFGDDVGTYVIFGELVRFVKEIFDINKENNIFIRVYSFLEDAANSDDKAVQEVVMFAFLEGICNYPGLLEFSKQFMGSTTTNFLKQVIDFWEKLKRD